MMLSIVPLSAGFVGLIGDFGGCFFGGGKVSHERLMPLPCLNPSREYPLFAVPE